MHLLLVILAVIGAGSLGFFAFEAKERGHFDRFIPYDRGPTLRSNFDMALIYKPQPMRSLEEIRADILALEKETEGLLLQIVEAY